MHPDKPRADAGPMERNPGALFLAGAGLLIAGNIVKEVKAKVSALLGNLGRGQSKN